MPLSPIHGANRYQLPIHIGAIMQEKFILACLFERPISVATLSEVLKFG